MDIQMPEMDGYEATRQIRKFDKDVIIIAQTAFGIMGDRQKAIDAGCNDYISKPINQDNLMGLIRKYFLPERLVVRLFSSSDHFILLLFHKANRFL